MDKFDFILKELRSELRAGKYPVGARFPSEYELAERFKVGKMTANKAVTVLVAEGYLTRGTRGSNTKVASFGTYPKKYIMFLGAVNHPHYARILHGLQLAALEHDCYVNVAAPQPDSLGTVLKKMRNAPVIGIVTRGYGIIECGSLPVLYVDEFVGQESYPNFVTDDKAQGGRMIINELIAKGHRDITVLQRVSGRDILDGIYSAMREHGMKDFRERTFSTLGYLSDYDIMAELKKILSRYPEVTAIVSDSDDNIPGLIRCLDKIYPGWRAKVTLTGFGGLESIAAIFPVATVDQHSERIGTEAFFSIMEMAEVPGTIIRKHIDVELIGAENIPLVR